MTSADACYDADKMQTSHKSCQPRTWKIMDGHLNPMFFAGYMVHLILVPKGKEMFISLMTKILNSRIC
jgi:hypothetical protein